jgi:hypothetical protein
MSSTDAPQQAGGLVAARYRHRRRGWITVAAVVVIAAAGAAGADAAGAFRSAGAPAVSSSGYRTQTEPVRRGTLTEQVQENATLGDAGSYTVTVPQPPPGSGAGTGTFTWLPSAGQTISQGQMIYQVSGTRWSSFTGTSRPTAT